MRRLRRIIAKTALFSVFTIVACWMPAYLWSDCALPHYKQGKVLEDSGRSVVLNISISPESFAPCNLLRLGTHFKALYPNRKIIAVDIFDSSVAARNSVPMVEWNPVLYAWEERRHADYYYDVDKGLDQITLWPDAHDPAIKQVIPLRAEQLPACNLVLSGRCLLSLSHIEYPIEARKTSSSGLVTLSGSIQSDGRVKNVRVTNNQLVGSDSESLLQFSVQNLGSWRFEKSVPKTDFQITYSFQLTGSPRLEHGYEVRFGLPKGLEIVANPI